MSEKKFWIISFTVSNQRLNPNRIYRKLTSIQTVGEQAGSRMALTVSPILLSII
jgi:hypothetical protein